MSSSTLLSVVDIILLILQEAKSPDGGLLLAKNDVDRLTLLGNGKWKWKCSESISILIRCAILTSGNRVNKYLWKLFKSKN